MKITATFYPSKNKNSGNLLGDASAVIRSEALGDLTIKKLRVVDGQNGAFVCLPQVKYQKDGDDKFFNILWASADWKKAIDEAVLAAYSESLVAK